MPSSPPIRVFVSATTADLGRHRDAVRHELRVAEIDVRIQEELGPDHRPLRDVLKAEIESRDAVVCLIGWVFGSAPSMTQDPPRSYTQLEFDYAVAAGVPVYAFLTPDDELPETFDEPRDLVDLQLRHRRSVRSRDNRWEEVRLDDIGQLRTRIAHLARRLVVERSATAPTRWLESIGGGIRVDGTLRSRDLETVYAGTLPGPPATPIQVRLLCPRHSTFHREWFRQRHLCWARLDHPNVVRVLPESRPDGTDPAPFTATEALGSHQSLEELLRHRRRMSDSGTMRVLRTAASLLAHADAVEVRVQTLDPCEVFLECAADDPDTIAAVKFGGFATATATRPVGGHDASAWAQVSDQWRHLAPEVRTSSSFLPATVDVFALGVLLQRMLDRPTEPQNEWRWVSGPRSLLDAVERDAWHCIAFHCLATDPNCRFRSPDHLLLVLDDVLDRPVESLPPTVDVAGGRLRVARHLTTNRDYARFCLHTGHHLPPHMVDPDQGARLAGPLLPVTGVDLRDAEAYCAWLTTSTGRRWRLPTAAEWDLAACSREARGLVHRGQCLHPWGSAPAIVPADPPHLRCNFGTHFGGPTVIGGFADPGVADECLDLAGNVFEWTTERNRMHVNVRGGAYDHEAESVRVGQRKAVLASTRDPHIGFRVVMEHEP